MNYEYPENSPICSNNRTTDPYFFTRACASLPPPQQKHQSCPSNATLYDLPVVCLTLLNHRKRVFVYEILVLVLII